MWDVWGVILGIGFVGFTLISHFPPHTSHFNTNNREERFDGTLWINSSWIIREIR